jgi:hypothetical protein
MSGAPLGGATHANGGTETGNPFLDLDDDLAF